MVIGRFIDGSPLTLSRTPDWLPENDNNFTYQLDGRGHRCPRHAHIRKVNPRGESGKDHEERSRRITRRGITYGSARLYGRDTPAAELPTGGVGLLFMCFQANIRRQFAYIQKRWCNNVEFVRGATGIDPLTGQSPLSAIAPQSWCPAYNNGESVPSDFGGYVTLKGGEYFFAPSLRFFEQL